MAQNENVASICSLERLDMIFTIVSRGKGEDLVDYIKEYGSLHNVICHGRGTATSRILEMLGLGATEKDVILSIVKNGKSKDIMQKISKKMDFAKPGKGICFSVPLESVAGMMTFKFLTADSFEED